MTSQKPVKFGIIGYSGSAKIYHLPYITPNKDIEVYAFLQRAEAPADPKSAKPGSHCTVDYPNAKHYRKEDDFFADPEIEVVVVCTREDTHAYFGERAVKAGKHVVVEKPFTRTSAEADQFIEIAKQSGKILTVFQNRRYDSDFETTSKIVKSGCLGEITECEIHYDVDTPAWAVGKKGVKWMPGDGLMYGLGAHAIDQALQLFGRPAKVTCFMRTLLNDESDVDNMYTLILQYDGKQKNLLVTVKTSVVSFMQEQLKDFVRGTDGTFMKFGECVQERQTFAGIPSTDPSFGVEAESSHGTLTTRSQFHPQQEYDEKSKKYIGKYPTVTGRYLSYYENVVDAVRGKAEIRVKPEESREGIRVMELARESNEKGVTVPWS